MKKLFFILIAMMISSSAFAELVQGTGRKTVTAAGTAEALSSTATSFSELSMCAETDNTGYVVVGSSTVVAALATRQGVPLGAGDCYTIVLSSGKLGTISTIYIDSTVSGDGVTYHYSQHI